ncbi:tetratricopeptide repeat protein [Candidatus Merdisoma sp. JLR.KK006]|uniref:tetratricopeptide repeat protein n=1 Tax=Candidatus Merdisoma sp. JLR.KK006 TaxID=3112626 RepID=UPI002FF00669
MYQESEREFVVTHNANIKPVSYFTGRETELQELRQRIEEGRKSVLVSGMGGIGKTHICRKLFEEYLNYHAKDGNGPFRHIGYIEYDGDMGSSLQNCLKFKRQSSPEQNQEAAWRELEYLAADGKLLLFVDNVGKPIGEDSGLERLKGIPGAVVLTSRQASFGDEFEPYQIGFLNMEQCKEIYEKIRFKDSGRKVRPEEEQDLEYVIEKLAGKHTITVEFLAHLAWTRHWTVKRLREELEEKGFCLEFHKDGELVNIQESYEKLYDLSELTEAEQNILEAFSVFPYIPLAAETCNEWLLADVGASEDDDILMGLYQKGWLQFDIDQESYVLHPVFAQFVYEKYRPRAEKHQRLIKACQKSLEIPMDGSVLRCQKFISFAENIIEKVDMIKGEEKVKVIGALSYLCQYVAENKRAEKWCKIDLKICKDIWGENYPETATSYNNLAGVYKNQGKFRKAKELCEKSLQIRERVLGEEHPDTLNSYNNLAYMYEEQGEYEKAKELYKKCLQIRERIFGEGHLKTAICYNNLAHIYKEQGKYGKAEELYRKSLQIDKRVLGEEHPDTADVYNNLAGVYVRQREYGKAEELYVKSLKIREKKLGKEHPDTAVSYGNLASVYFRQKKEYEKAEILCRRELKILEKALGKKHPETATGYSRLACVYTAQKNYRKAKEFYEKSLQINEEVFGKEHPNTAISYNNLATIYAYQAEYENAVEFYKKSLRIREMVLGEEHFDTLESYNSLAYVYKSQGRYKKAEELYEKSLQINKRLLGEEHPDMVDKYNKLAHMYLEQKEYGKAIELFKKSLQIKQRLMREGHLDTAVDYNNIAYVYMSQNEFKIALAYFFKAYKILTFNLGLNHSNSEIVYKNMKNTFYKWDPEGDFEQWLEEQMKK